MECSLFTGSCDVQFRMDLVEQRRERTVPVVLLACSSPHFQVKAFFKLVLREECICIQEGVPACREAMTSQALLLVLIGPAKHHLKRTLMGAGCPEPGFTTTTTKVFEHMQVVGPVCIFTRQPLGCGAPSFCRLLLGCTASSL